MKHIRYDLDTCMDIFDWFGTADYDYLAHTLVSKADAEWRLSNAMPEIRKRAQWLVRVHRGSENAYPEDTVA